MEKESLSDRLKARTSVSHQQLEKALIIQMRGMRNQEDYISLLQLFYSYFSALEDQINQYIGTEQLPDYMERRKTESLVDDIRSLGGVLPEKAKKTDLPQIDNHLQAFGALYVIEGSTLGGQIISNMIAKQLHITDKGLSFFKSYGDATNAMWEDFKKVLNNLQLDNPADQESIINAADDTFFKFKLCIDN